MGHKILDIDMEFMAVLLWNVNYTAPLWTVSICIYTYILRLLVVKQILAKQI